MKERGTKEKAAGKYDFIPVYRNYIPNDKMKNNLSGVRIIKHTKLEGEHYKS